MADFIKKAKRLIKLASLPLLLLASPASAVELGLTPNHVFATWMNINETLIALGSTIDESGALTQRVSKMSATKFSGKKPGEVLEQLIVFRGKLDRLSAKHGLKSTPVFKDPAGGTVTPSVVFMNSGNVLDSSVLLLATLDDKKLISSFFTRYEISGKTPSGPFSLVELANRRMDALLN